MYTKFTLRRDFVTLTHDSECAETPLYLPSIYTYIYLSEYHLMELFDYGRPHSKKPKKKKKEYNSVEL